MSKANNENAAEFATNDELVCELVSRSGSDRRFLIIDIRADDNGVSADLTMPKKMHVQEARGLLCHCIDMIDSATEESMKE